MTRLHRLKVNPEMSRTDFRRGRNLTPTTSACGIHPRDALSGSNLKNFSFAACVAASAFWRDARGGGEEGGGGSDTARLKLRGPGRRLLSCGPF